MIKDSQYLLLNSIKRINLHKPLYIKLNSNTAFTFRLIFTHGLQLSIKNLFMRKGLKFYKLLDLERVYEASCLGSSRLSMSLMLAM